MNVALSKEDHDSTYQPFVQSDPTNSSSTYQRIAQSDPTDSVEISDEIVRTESDAFTSVRDSVKIILEHRDHNPLVDCVQGTIICMIFLSTACVILETMPEVEEKYKDSFSALELVFTALFTLETILRIWVADCCYEYWSCPGNLVDILSILPWYLEFAVMSAYQVTHHTFSNPDDEKLDQFADSFQNLRMVRMIRMVRLARVARLAKTVRHSETLTTMLESVSHSFTGLLALCACISVATVFSATVMYYMECEHEQTQFTSIPAALWWALPTITGVGYGDMVPHTAAGKVTAGVSMVCGTMITSLCVAILTNSFIAKFQKSMKELDLAQKRRKHFFKKKGGRLSNRGKLGSLEDIIAQRSPGADLGATHAIILPDGVDVDLRGLAHDIQGVVDQLLDRLQEHTSDGADHTNNSLEMIRSHSTMLFKHIAAVTDDIEAEDHEAAHMGHTASMVSNAPREKRVSWILG